MRVKWPLWVLGTVLAWLIIAIITNDSFSGLVFGAAAGSNTIRDPVFITLEFGIGVVVRRWWQLLLSSVLIGIVYTMWVASSILHESSTFTYLGRVLSILVTGSVIVLLRDLVSNGD